MDHTYIEEHQITDRYVLGTLPDAEAERFEDHYLSCPECLDRLQLAESMQRGFQRAAQQDAQQIKTASQLAVVAWLARLSRGRQAAVFSGVLAVLAVLAVLPAGLALRGNAERSRALAQARSALEHRSAETENLRQELAREREARARAIAQLAQADQPQINVPIAVLDAERGGPAGGAALRVRLPKNGRSIVFQAVIDPPYPAPRSYGAVLRDAHGRELWRRTDLQLDPGSQTLNLLLPASLVAPGDYTLAVEGLTPGRKSIALGSFPCRVLPPR